MRAAMHGNLETVVFFVEKGANINARDNFSWTPLMNAASVNDTPERLEMVKFLVGKGADINVINRNGMTAYELAKKLKNENIAVFLSCAETSVMVMADARVALGRLRRGSAENGARRITV